LFSDDPVSAETIDTPKAFEFDIYAVAWRGDFTYNPLLKTKFERYTEWFVLVYGNPDGKVYRPTDSDSK
jgi:hypothetical protein